MERKRALMSERWRLWPADQASSRFSPSCRGVSMGVPASSSDLQWFLGIFTVLQLALMPLFFVLHRMRRRDADARRSIEGPSTHTFLFARITPVNLEASARRIAVGLRSDGYR